MQEFISPWVDYESLFLFVDFISPDRALCEVGFYSILLCMPLKCWMVSQHVHYALFSKLFFLSNVEAFLFSSFVLSSYVKVKEGMTI